MLSSENGIKLDKQKFKDTFVELEEENLFMMNQIQEKELQLEEIKKGHEEQANAKRKEIKKSEDNVERLKSSLLLAKVIYCVILFRTFALKLLS